MLGLLAAGLLLAGAPHAPAASAAPAEAPAVGYVEPIPFLPDTQHDLLAADVWTDDAGRLHSLGSYGQPTSRLVHHVSADLGRTWSAGTLVGQVHFATQVRAFPTAAGVLAFWQSFQGGPGGYPLSMSLYDGASWSTPVDFAWTYTGGSEWSLAQSPSGHLLFASLPTDPDGLQAARNLYMGQVSVRRSSDGGRTWTSPTLEQLLARDGLNPQVPSVFEIALAPLADGEFALAFRDAGQRLYFTTSDSAPPHVGSPWAVARRINSDVPGFTSALNLNVPAKTLQLVRAPSGLVAFLALPYREGEGLGDPWKEVQVAVSSPDGGATWTERHMVAGGQRLADDEALAQPFEAGVDGDALVGVRDAWVPRSIHAGPLPAAHDWTLPDVAPLDRGVEGAGEAFEGWLGWEARGVRPLLVQRGTTLHVPEGSDDGPAYLFETFLTRLATPGPGNADGDAYADGEDAFPNDPREHADADGDGLGDWQDHDDDQDGLPDVQETHRGSDALDPDSPVPTRDGDGDGRPDLLDNCPARPNGSQLDRDADGLGDACDADDDNDGLRDAADNCRFAANSGQEDRDGDGAGDACDDSDGDRVLDSADNCPTVPNRTQADADGDGIGNPCEDADADGVFDPVDNCRAKANPLQGDSDGDGRGDACDRPALAFTKQARARTLTVSATEPGLRWDHLAVGGCGAPSGDAAVDVGDVLPACSGAVAVHHVPSGLRLYGTTFA